MTSGPSSLFFQTPAQRLALARQQFFEEGKVPAGGVNHAVLDSWARCRWRRLDPYGALAFDPVTASRSHLALQRNRLLVGAWQDELAELEHTLAGTACSAILTDASGVLLAVAGAGRGHDVIMPVAHRVGVDLSEEAAGTTAPGVVLKTGKPALVQGEEHFYRGVGPMFCAAAPIHNAKGQLAGVFDVSCEGRPFDFDVAAVVSLYATAIENRLLLAQSRGQLVLRLQISPALLETPMVGLVGIDGVGHLRWANGVALRLLRGQSGGEQTLPTAAEPLLGVSLPRLLALPRQGAAPLRLANGLSVWMRAAPPQAGEPEVDAVPGALPLGAPATTAAAPATTFAATPPAATVARASLHDAQAGLILQTVQECQGNVAEAARRLRVSRGLIYRRLRAARGDA